MQTDIKRRKFLQTAGLYLAATSATCIGCSNAFGSSHSRGCALSDNDVGGLDGLFAEHHDRGINARFSKFTKDLSKETKLYPSFAFMQEENGYNAFALSKDVVGSSSDGAVLFGMKLITHVSKSPALSIWANHTAMQAIMAHEWAHIAQFKYDIETPTVKPTELMADFVAGWFVAKEEHAHDAKMRRWQAEYEELGDKEMSESYIRSAAVDISATAMPMVTSLGDRAFNSAGHHGTPEERLAAYTEGVKFFRLYNDSTFTNAMVQGHILYIG